MADNRPAWLPDTQGFLAIAILVLVGSICMVLLVGEPVKMDDKTSGALVMLLGVLTACLKDVYSFHFGSSYGSDKKDTTLTKLATESAVPLPPVPPTPDQRAASVLTTGEMDYFKTLGDDDAKKRFLAMSPGERAAIIAQVGT